MAGKCVRLWLAPLLATILLCSQVYIYTYSRHQASVEGDSSQVNEESGAKDSIEYSNEGGEHMEDGEEIKIAQLYETCFSSCVENIVDQNENDDILCGKSSLNRGINQKVASFSFYGDLKSAYYNGIRDNLNTLEDFYPGWVMRLYLDENSLEVNSTRDLCHLACSTNRLDICSVRKLHFFGDISSKFGMVWRFLPMADPTVDIMVSRDLDSRFSVRETAAVEDWLSTGLPFHIMRDNPYHGTHILGGMWGARTDLGNRKRYRDMTIQLINKCSSAWAKGMDQGLLANIVWPKVKHEAAVHDAYSCSTYPTPNNRPWPTQRRDEPANFVGSIGEMKIDKECPTACRPKDHLDWTKC